MGSTDTLKITVTAQEGGKAKRPHQAFLVLQEAETGLEAPFPFTTKENGKATVDIVRARRIGLQAHDWQDSLANGVMCRNTPRSPCSS